MFESFMRNLDLKKMSRNERIEIFLSNNFYCRIILFMSHDLRLTDLNAFLNLFFFFFYHVDSWENIIKVGIGSDKSFALYSVSDNISQANILRDEGYFLQFPPFNPFGLRMME